MGWIEHATGIGAGLLETGRGGSIPVAAWRAAAWALIAAQTLFPFLGAVEPGPLNWLAGEERGDAVNPRPGPCLSYANHG